MGDRAADAAVLFGVAYLLVRLLHIVLYAIVGRDDPDLLGAVLLFAPTSIFGASLLVLAGFLEGDVRIAVWVVALAIDYVGPAVLGAGRGWRIAPEHFAERHGLVILIALGESIIAIGVGAGFALGAGVIAAAALGIVVISALWWLYFDVAAIFVRALSDRTGCLLPFHQPGDDGRVDHGLAVDDAPDCVHEHRDVRDPLL